MTDIINLILNEKLSPDHLFSWINGEFKNLDLEEFDHLRQNFVPLFLNFLRDQTSSFLHSSMHTGLTPGKATPSLKRAKVISARTNSQSDIEAKNTSKAKLDFSDSFVSIFESKTSICPGIKPINGGASHTKNIESFPSKSIEGESSFSLQTSIASVETNSQSDFPPLSKTSTLYNSSNKTCQNDVLSPLSPVYSVIPPPRNKKFSPINTSTPGRDSTARVDLKSYLKREPSDSRLSEQKISLSEFIVERKKGKRKSIQKNNSPERLDEQSHSNFEVSGSKNSPKKTAAKKRINPTRINLSSNENVNIFSSKNQTPNPAFTSLEEQEPLSAAEDRLQIKQEIKKISDQNSSLGVENKVSSHFAPNRRNILSHDLVTPQLANVTNRRELNILCKIYSNLILYNMVPNILVELYFLFQLLTINVAECNSFGDSDIYFSTIHNCVYFSISCLSCIISCLTHLDKSTLKLLSENSRIQSFDSPLHTRLTEVAEGCQIARPRPPKSPILSVSFQSETDNRDNFPSSVAFQIFKKQRDIFYQIIRMWETHHLEPNWTFEVNLKYKVEGIMKIIQDSPIIMMHFARLFHFQLLAMCKGNHKIDIQSDVDDLSIVMQLKRERPDKYNRLFERLVQPQKFGGPVPSPSFPGAQEFFHSFIMAASNPSFNCFLRDSLISAILEINDTALQIDLEEVENIEYVKDEIYSTLESLRLLAKFLGFLEFLPYQTSGFTPENVIANQISLRRRLSPPLPLNGVIIKAAKSRALVVVIPWVAEYLSMVDPIALHTPYYSTVAFMLIFLLHILYTFQLDLRSANCDSCSAKDSVAINPFSSFYLKIILGWLFSLPNFPDGLFYAIDEETDIDLATLEEFRELVRQTYASLCSNCLKAQASNQSLLNDFSNASSSSGISDMLSPIKCEEGYFSSPVKVIGRTPSKLLYDASPLKTPSKALCISMVDTPNVTPLNTPNIKQSSSDVRKLNVGFDALPLINHQVLLMCCPYVGELKSLLSEFAFGVARNKANNIRKITPLTASEKVVEQPEVSLQLQLEENFFHNKPSSTKKTVEFVAERIYSNVLRHLRLALIPALKDKYLQQLKSQISSSIVANTSITADKLTEMVDQKTSEMSQTLAGEVREGAMQEMERLSTTDELASSLNFLLPIEVTPASAEICCKIVRRMARERISAWLNVHVISGFCTKELLTDAAKFIKSTLKSSQMDLSVSLCNSSASALTTTGLEDQTLDTSMATQSNPSKKQQDDLPINASEHDESVPSPSSIAIELKEILSSLMALKIPDWTLQARQENTLRMIKNIHDVTLKRKDIMPTIFKALSILTLDWIVALSICEPEVMSKEVVKKALQLWLPINVGGVFQLPDNDIPFISARSIMLLGQRSPELQLQSWKKMETILTAMILRHKMFTPNAFQESCITLLRYSWPQNILNGLSQLIKNILDALKKHPSFKDDPEVHNFTDWVGWVCSEMDS